jgi:RNA polymerase sigma-70 factor (ECF subfamily)
VEDEKAQQSRPDFADVLRRYNSALRRLAWSYARTAADSEDLFQEIALALWKAVPNFRGDSSERTYIYRIAHNTAISFVTSRHRTAKREQIADEHSAEPASTANPERDAIQKERRQKLWSAVQQLPVIDRQIIVLYLEGLPAAEIEEVTGFSSGKVAMRLSRIRRRLADQLNENVTEGRR